jgi:hypothetical protein
MNTIGKQNNQYFEDITKDEIYIIKVQSSRENSSENDA